MRRLTEGQRHILKIREGRWRGPNLVWYHWITFLTKTKDWFLVMGDIKHLFIQSIVSNWVFYYLYQRLCNWYTPTSPLLSWRHLPFYTSWNRKISLKQHIYYYTISESQEARNGLAGSSAKLKSRCQSEVGSYLKAQIEKVPLPRSLRLMAEFIFLWL